MIGIESRLGTALRRLALAWRRSAAASPDPWHADDVLERDLRDVHLTREDLRGARADSPADMRRMMERFGIEANRVPAVYLGALRDAERVCAQCTAARRCHRWFEGDSTADAPRLFCPNASLFQEIFLSRAANANRRQAGETL